MDYSVFWRNSLIAALTSKILAQNTYPDVAEDAFFVGLLHDIGILLMIQCLPDQYSLVLQEIAKTQCGFQDAENQILGFDHADVGAYFTKKWGFAESFSVPIQYQHYPEKLSPKKDKGQRQYSQFSFVQARIFL